MSKQVLIITVLVILLLTCLATHPSISVTTLVQTMFWSAPNSELSISVLGIQLSGECECGGNGNCPI